MKYESLALWETKDGRDLVRWVSECVSYCNKRRPRQAIRNQTPDEVHFTTITA